MQEFQDDAMFKRDIPLAIRESNEIFAKSVQQMNSSILLLAQGMNRSMEMFTRSSFQERPLSHYFMQPAGPTQSQGEFNRIPSQQNYSCDGTDTHSSFHVNNSVRSSNESGNQENYFESDNLRTYHNL